MRKIAFLGAGSFGFGRRLVGDLLSFPELADSTIHLVDPARERLEGVHAAARRMAGPAGGGGGHAGDPPLERVRGAHHPRHRDGHARHH